MISLQPVLIFFFITSEETPKLLNRKQQRPRDFFHHGVHRHAGPHYTRIIAIVLSILSFTILRNILWVLARLLCCRKRGNLTLGNQLLGRYVRD